MKNVFPDGVWPVMLTPFTEQNNVDYTALERLTEWYFQNGSSGLFAVCQSSEVFFLSLKERLAIASLVKKTAKDRPVIASGHISDAEEDQVQIGKTISRKKIVMKEYAFTNIIGQHIEGIKFGKDRSRKARFWGRKSLLSAA